MRPIAFQPRLTSRKSQPSFWARRLKLTRWLLEPERAQKPFCVVASSAEINQGVFYELWQIVPELKKGGFDTRIIQLGQVDSQNGPPPVEIRKCEIALVGIPFQTHLQPGQQTTLQIVQEDLVAGTGIGAAFARSPREFVMDGNIKMLAYVRTREISDAEYSNLVERFLRAKGPGYVNPTP